jgi:exosome complex component RRP4
MNIMEHRYIEPGQYLTSKKNFIRGHGTFCNNAGSLISSTLGFVEKTHRLLRVLSTKNRYIPKIGHCIQTNLLIKKY